MNRNQRFPYSWLPWIYAIAAIALYVLVLPLAFAGDPNTSDAAVTAKDLSHGQWMIDAVEDGRVQFTLKCVTKQGQHWHSSDVAAAAFEGLAAGDLGDGRHEVKFALRRDAGTFACEGSMKNGAGAGTFELTLDPSFAAELARRGVGRPTELQQARLALAGAGLDLLDEIERQNYDRPDVAMLLRMANHGVDLGYVQGMASLGHKGSSLDQLVMLRDHGVDPGFIRGMREAGFDGVTTETLLRARDHGANPAYAAAMSELGYRNLTLEMLIRARDHGVDAAYARGLAKAGYGRLTLAELIQARDHGVDPSFARRAREKYGDELSMAEVIRLRDRGEMR